ALRGGDDVFNHFGHLGGRIRGAQDDSTIDQDVVRPVTIGTRQRNQKAIAQALSVHSDLGAIAPRNLRICAGAGLAPLAFFCDLRATALSYPCTRCITANGSSAAGLLAK